ncbi:hypothetical protein LWI28_025428 [Acer negundo]|uniref:Protein FAR1-RELATED SEQUENCE n=1 Tax=Acer negundo TaxID=4023 RepID=A0AAD5JMZ3_ACENE|nr:hypothetical protein LWI28_025428 [Acer negundo]
MARNKTFNVDNPRPTGKTECKAKINALRFDGKLRLTTVHNIHNHGLSPKKSCFFRCNREVSDVFKRGMDTNDMSSVRMNKSFGSLVVGTCGFENLPFLEKDCRNYIDKARHLRLGADGAGALQEYFVRKQYKNHGFFALMDLDDDRRETRGAPFCHIGADVAVGTHRRLYVEDELGMKFTTTMENDEDENDGEDEIERQTEIQS